MIEHNRQTSKELHTDRFTERDVLMGIGEKSCDVVTLEDLNLATVAAAAQQELAVGRDVELAGMGTSGLVSDAG